MIFFRQASHSLFQALWSDTYPMVVFCGNCFDVRKRVLFYRTETD